MIKLKTLYYCNIAFKITVASQHVSSRYLWYLNIIVCREGWSSFNTKIISLLKAINSVNENSRLNKRLVLVDGKWELLWTTEKQTLFFLKYRLRSIDWVGMSEETTWVMSVLCILYMYPDRCFRIRWFEHHWHMKYIQAITIQSVQQTTTTTSSTTTIDHGRVNY